MDRSVQSTERPQASCPQAPATWQRLESGRCNLVTTGGSDRFFFIIIIFKCSVPENCHITHSRTVSSTHTFWSFTFSLQLWGKQTSLRTYGRRPYWMQHFWSTRVSLKQTSVSEQSLQRWPQGLFSVEVCVWLPLCIGKHCDLEPVQTGCPRRARWAVESQLPFELNPTLRCYPNWPCPGVLGVSSGQTYFYCNSSDNNI